MLACRSQCFGVAILFPQVLCAGAVLSSFSAVVFYGQALCFQVFLPLMSIWVDIFGDPRKFLLLKGSRLDIAVYIS